MRSEKGALGGKREESREKREERSEKRETSTIKIRGSKDAMVRSQIGGMAQKKGRPLRGKREESREKREQREEEIEKIIETRGNIS